MNEYDIVFDQEQLLQEAWEESTRGSSMMSRYGQHVMCGCNDCRMGRPCDGTYVPLRTSRRRQARVRAVRPPTVLSRGLGGYVAGVSGVSNTSIRRARGESP